MVSGWRRGGVRVLLGTRHQCAHQQVERSPSAQRTETVLAPHIYLAQRTTAISGVCCLAPKSMRKTVNIVNYISKKVFTYFWKTVASKFVSPYHHECAKHIYKVPLYLAQVLLTIQSRCLPFCFFRPAKIQYVECFQDNTCHN